VFLHEVLGWDFWQVGGYLAAWVMIYGMIQAAAPKLTGRSQASDVVGRQLVVFGGCLALTPAAIGLALSYGLPPVFVVTVGLLIFALLFAMNSALHSFLIVRFARDEGASLDIGFYYMANAGGRLAGTIGSGALYQWMGLEACLWVSAGLIAIASLAAMSLPKGEVGTA
jgi:hypothetical protein